jgi:hypothetical protein
MDAPTPQAKYLYLVQTSFGGDDPQGWGTWYDTKHIPELLSVPGFVAADRYRHVTKPDQYIAVYEINDPAVFSEERYGHVTGWSEWMPAIREWRRGMFERLADPPRWARTL